MYVYLNSTDSFIAVWLACLVWLMVGGYWHRVLPPTLISGTILYLFKLIHPLSGIGQRVVRGCWPDCDDGTEEKQTRNVNGELSADSTEMR